jgi:hypothetical protein
MGCVTAGMGDRMTSSVVASSRKYGIDVIGFMAATPFMIVITVFCGCSLFIEPSQGIDGTFNIEHETSNLNLWFINLD